jgi:hypothetical protein
MVSEVWRGERKWGNMARKPTSTRPGGENPFSEEDNAIAWLLAGHDSDRTIWSDHTATEITNVRAMSLFFCPLMGQLRGRGKTIQKKCNEHAALMPLNVQRRHLNTLARGESVTLDSVLHVYKVLNAIAVCHEEKVKATTRVRRRNRDACLVFEENDVIPSHIWVKRTLITAFRDNFGISRNKLAEIMFGDGKYDDFFHVLEDGEKAKNTEYDYRVTPFTKECILFTMTGLFESLPVSQGNHRYTLPSSGELFDASSTAGLEATIGQKLYLLRRGISPVP